MSADDSLPRLDESAEDPVLREALGSARRDVPSDERMKALSLAFGAKLGAAGASGAGGAGGASSPGGATGSGSVGAGAASALGIKGVGIVAAAIIGASALWYTTRPAPSPPEPAKPVPAAIVESAVPTKPVPPKSDPVPTLSVEDLPKAPANAAPKPSAQETPKESDTALLGRAQKELGKNPANALALLGEHAKTFPRSGFGQEREVMTIDALIRLGRRGEAEARAGQFAKAYPKSAHNRRIDSLLGR
jgi:hypothetical protein